MIEPNVKRGAKPTGYTPRDPFDPEIFNLRHFPNRRPAPTEPAA